MSRKVNDPTQIALKAIQEALNISSGDPERAEFVLVNDVVDIFKSAGWKVANAAPRPRRFSPDLIATRIELGRERRYGIECKLSLNSRIIQEQHSRFRNWLRQVKEPFEEFDELWLVGYEYADKSRTIDIDNDRHFRFLDLKELRALVAPSSNKRPKSRTKVGKAVEANAKAIQLAIATLTLQIDGKLEALRDERPNSPEAITARDKQIVEYDNMRAQLEAIRTAVIKYISGDEKEKDVVKSVATFKDGLQSWWSKRHANICDNAAAGSLFLGSAGLLHLMNADSSITLAIAGTMFGGESIVKALKALPRKLF